MFNASRAREKELSKKAIKHSYLFAPWEFQYIKNRIPYEEDETLSEFAFRWAEAVGNREEMGDIVRELGTPDLRAKFALRFSSQKQKMKKEVRTARSAFVWAREFPEDSDDVKKFVQGGKWAVHWAKEIGDEKEMKSKVTTRYWKLKFQDEVEEESVRYVSK